MGCNTQSSVSPSCSAGNLRVDGVACSAQVVANGNQSWQVGELSAQKLYRVAVRSAAIDQSNDLSITLQRPINDRVNSQVIIRACPIKFDSQDTICSEPTTDSAYLIAPPTSGTHTLVVTNSGTTANDYTITLSEHRFGSRANSAHPVNVGRFVAGDTGLFAGDVSSDPLYFVSYLKKSQRMRVALIGRTDRCAVLPKANRPNDCFCLVEDEFGVSIAYAKRTDNNAGHNLGKVPSENVYIMRFRGSNSLPSISCYSYKVRLSIVDN